jgi:ATP-dependent RNA helicase DHX29
LIERYDPSGLRNQTNIIPNIPVSETLPESNFPTPITPTENLQTDARLNATAPILLPSGEGNSDTATLSTPNEAIPQCQKEKADNSAENNDIQLRMDPDNLDEDNPNMQYARVKVRLEDILSLKHTKGPKQVMSQIPALRAQLQSLQKNYFFDAQEADSLVANMIQNPRTIAQIAEIKDSSSSELRNLETADEPTAVVASAPGNHSEDILDEDGGFFDILEAMPGEVVTPEGNTIPVRDMALPKHWSGRTPKILLKELVDRLDKYAAISYSVLSGSSRAKRASVHIRWDGQRTENWPMENVACYDQTQAEQYAATLALHALSFPSTEGFEAGGTAVGNNSLTFFRLLPSPFRGLWDELEEARKSRVGSTNRLVWAKLKEILQAKLERPRGVSTLLTWRGNMSMKCCIEQSLTKD